MIWNRDVVKDKVLLAVGQFMMLFAILSFLYGAYLVLYVLLISIALIYLHKWYSDKIGLHFLFHNEKQIHRFSMEDEGDWSFHFINKGLPILKGTLTFTFNDKVEPSEGSYEKRGYIIEVSIPFKAWINETVDIKIPFKAVKRGISTIHKIEVKIPHMLGTGVVILENREVIKTKIYVYPKRLPVIWAASERVKALGTYQDRSSLFYDHLQPVGIREYRTGDPLHYIHWKASARMQQLQTKIFTNVSRKNWLLLLNMDRDLIYEDKLEDTISSLAFLVDTAVKENIPFSVAANVRTSLNVPYFFLKEGEGRLQRQKAFDLLVMLSPLDITIPFHQMVHHIEMQETLFSSVIYFGTKNETVQTAFSKYKHKGSTLLAAETVNKQGVIKLW